MQSQRPSLAVIRRHIEEFKAYDEAMRRPAPPKCPLPLSEDGQRVARALALVAESRARREAVQE